MRGSLLGGLLLASRIRSRALPIVSAELGGARDRLARRVVVLRPAGC